MSMRYAHLTPDAYPAEIVQPVRGGVKAIHSGGARTNLYVDVGGTA
jgi:hypothetical protein